MVSGGLNKIGMVGQRIGKLVVIEENGKRKRRVLWKCICDCGNEKTVAGFDLRSGSTNSCGCLLYGKEHRQKMSDNHANFSGKNNPNWNQDITAEEREIQRNYPEYNKWREAVYEKNDYICQICGVKGGNLNAHHLEGYRKNTSLRTTLSNGVTMCIKCHLDFHRQYGKRNNTKKQFEEFIRRKTRWLKIKEKEMVRVV